MGNIAIVTDSTSDIPKDLCKKYNIAMVSLTVNFGSESYKNDGIDITNKEFYKKLEDSDMLPKSAQPSPGDFIKIYRELLKTYDDIISIHISTKMSGTIDSAKMAKKELKTDNIEIIDSKLVHMPFGLIVIEAAKLALEGKPKQEILSTINDLMKKIRILFIPNTLKYLKKGGRIGRAKGLIASLLEIKPLLTLKNGEVSQYKTTRRWNQAKNELINSMRDIIGDTKELIVVVSDSDAEEEGKEMANRIKNEFNPKELIRSEIGIVVGTHLGPGGIAVTFYGKK